jgi:two-component system response regulator
MQPKQVILIEDNSADVALFLRATKKYRSDVDVKLICDAEDVLAWIKEGPEKHLALVVLDLKLPKIDGLSLLKSMRQSEALKTVRVVAFTSSDEHSDIQQAYELGVSAYVRKPVDFDEYMETVESMYDFWLRNVHASDRLVGV